MRCYGLAAAIIFCLSLQQPSELPKSKGAPEGAGAPVANQEKGSKGEKTYPEQTPASPPSAVAKAPPANPQGSASELDENILVLFTGLLVVVGTFTALFVGWQALETRRAAEATRKSVELQEIALRQWVEIENWRITPHIHPEGQTMLNIQFDVANPTSLQISLQRISVVVDGQCNDLLQRNDLPPKNRCPVQFSIGLDGAQWKKLMEEKLVLRTLGNVWFEDAQGKAQAQAFDGMLVCTKTEVWFSPYHGAGFYYRGEKHKPN